MPDSSEIDNALTAKLLADTGPGSLMALMPDGVFTDEAGASIVDGQQAKRFLLVSLVDAHDEPVFGRRAFEACVFEITAVALSKIAGVALPATTMKLAAARLDLLLDPQPPLPPATLTIPGYGLMLLRRDERIRFTEVDAADSSIRWFHRGGRYQLWAAPKAA